MTYEKYLYEFWKNSYTNSLRVCIRNWYEFVYEKFWKPLSFVSTYAMLFIVKRQLYPISKWIVLLLVWQWLGCPIYKFYEKVGQLFASTFLFLKHLILQDFSFLPSALIALFIHPSQQSSIAWYHNEEHEKSPISHKAYGT